MRNVIWESFIFVLAMKKIFFFSISVVISLTTKAQNYLPLPDSNVTWIVDVDDGGPGPDSFWKYMTDTILNDTVINSISYIKLYGAPAPNSAPDGYIGGYRSDTTGKTFYIPLDSTQEFLLIDLSANIGDTIFNVLYSYGTYLYYPLQYCIVDSINNINDGPYLLKRLYVRFPQAPGFPQLTWIEKIGTNGGFFNNSPAGLSYIFLQCLSFNDTTYFSSWWPYDDPVYFQGTCQLPSDINEVSHFKEINISPNPTTTIFTLQTTNQQINNSTITISNTLGEKILEQKLISEKTEINLSHQPKGIYFVKVMQGDKMAVRKIVLM